MKKIVSGLLSAILLLGGVTAQAQEQLKVKFRSRALLDAACRAMAKKTCKAIIGWKISGSGSKRLTDSGRQKPISDWEEEK